LASTTQSDDRIFDNVTTSDSRNAAHRMADIGASFRDIGVVDGGSVVVANPMYVRRAHGTAPSPDAERALDRVGTGSSDGDATTSALSVYFPARQGGVDGRSVTRAARVGVLGVASHPPS
jgi:hypothetical protein